jgi:hypothetical protein
MTATAQVAPVAEAVPGLAPLGSEAAPPGADARVRLAALAGDAPPLLLEVVTAAVDPLEIAACLETCGLSNAVVKNRFGYNDVFGLAQQLYRSSDFRAAPAKDRRTTRPGGVVDLGRGIVFATPTLMFAGSAIALRSWLSWWTVPLALTCGWAFGQFVSYRGFSRQAAAEAPGAAVVWALLAALVTCACLGLAGDAVLGGRWSGVLFAAAACAFMTAAAELVVHADERLIGLMLVPGALGSLVFITREPFVLPTFAAVALAGASVVGTVLAALRRLPRRWWRLPVMSRAELPTAARYFAYGVCCGLFVALFMVLEPARTRPSTWPAAAAYPMVLSLGAMEWQLRSLRAAARGNLLRSHTLTGFARSVRKQLALSVLWYVTVLVALTGLVQALAYARGVAVPLPLLLAGACLAVAFFLALVVSACGRVELALRAWTAGLATFGAWAIVAKVSHPGGALPGIDAAFCTAALVSAVALAFAANRAVVNPFCHA